MLVCWCSPIPSPGPFIDVALRIVIGIVIIGIINSLPTHSNTYTSWPNQTTRQNSCNFGFSAWSGIERPYDVLLLLSLCLFHIFRFRLNSVGLSKTAAAVFLLFSFIIFLSFSCFFSSILQNISTQKNLPYSFTNFCSLKDGSALLIWR